MCVENAIIYPTNAKACIFSKSCTEFYLIYIEIIYFVAQTAECSNFGPNNALIMTDNQSNSKASNLQRFTASNAHRFESSNAQRFKFSNA